MPRIPVPKSQTTVLIEARLAGVSGDKYLGALLDLGGSILRLKAVGRVVKDRLPGTKEVQVEVSDVERGEVGAKLVTIMTEETVGQRKGEVLRKAIAEASTKIGLSSWGTEFSLATIDTLLEAEAKVHRRSKKDVELHELGSSDTLVDILGVASLVEEAGLDQAVWWSTPIAVGGGVSHFSQRDYPNPPPAVSEILRARNFPMQGDNVKNELSTPTGVAITMNLASRVADDYPAFRPAQIGYGAGSKDLKEIANVLRLTVGKSAVETHRHDQIVVLETNVDDVSGEVVGHTVEKLMAAGARDVSVAPIYMKKNRPGHLISVITDEARGEEMAEILMRETGTLGVREIPVRRHIALRTTRKVTVDIEGKKFPVTAKSAVDEKGRVLRTKIEYEDRKQLAAKTGVAIRTLQPKSVLRKMPR